MSRGKVLGLASLNMIKVRVLVVSERLTCLSLIYQPFD